MKPNIPGSSTLAPPLLDCLSHEHLARTKGWREKAGQRAGAVSLLRRFTSEAGRSFWAPDEGPLFLFLDR
jgi:hypothetical protein